MEKTENERRSIWMYDGALEYVGLSVGPAQLDQGGYVIALVLKDGTIRVAATSNPAKYLTSWQNNIRRFGLPEVERVLVSKPHVRYESYKRAIVKDLGIDLAAPDTLKISPERLTEVAAHIEEIIHKNTGASESEPNKDAP